MAVCENVQLFTTTIHFSLLEFLSFHWSEVDSDSLVVVHVAAAVAAAVVGAVTTVVHVAAAAVVAIVIVTKHTVLLKQVLAM